VTSFATLIAEDVFSVHPAVAQSQFEVILFDGLPVTREQTGAGPRDARTSRWAPAVRQNLIKAWMPLRASSRRFSA